MALTLQQRKRLKIFKEKSKLNKPSKSLKKRISMWYKYVVDKIRHIYNI